MAAMRRGDFAGAWNICDSILDQRCRTRVDCSRWPRHLQYVWDGSALDGKRILVRCYHGLGDTIQFVRLMPLIRQRAAQVTLWTQSSLLRVLRGVRGVDRLMPLHDGAPPATFDGDIEIMEVMHAVRIEVGQIPAQVPYIYVSPTTTGAGRIRLGDGYLNVGLVWNAGDWNAQRSIPAHMLAPLRQVPDIRWHSLQYPHEEPPFETTDLACRDLLAMAMRMRQLNLVITVDTMTAHLAGALGLPVWLLLHDDPDWRWMRARNDSPWYPTMRLFRQQRSGDWNSVVDEVTSALPQATARRVMQRRPMSPAR